MQTKIEAINLAKVWINKYNSGEFKSYSDFHYNICKYLINSKYIHLSNNFVTEFWNYIHININ